MARPVCEYRPSITMAFLLKSGYLKTGSEVRGLIEWGNGKASVCVVVALTDCPSIRITYALAGERHDQTISLTATRPHFGGRRWWFKCCGRRSAAIFLAALGTFACRRCHGLAYRSQQQAHGKGKAGDFMRDLCLAYPKKDPAKIRYRLWRGMPTKRYQRATVKERLLMHKIGLNGLTR